MSSDMKVPAELLRRLIAARASTRSTMPGDDAPASLSQIDRLEVALGMPLFHPLSEPRLTEVGQYVIDLAQRVLAADDATAKRSKFADEPEMESGPVRIGMNSMILDFFIDHPDSTVLQAVQVTSATCSTIIKSFIDDEIDIALCMDIKDHRRTLTDHLVAEFDMDFAWMKTDRFVLNAGDPIPLATWPADNFMFPDVLTPAACQFRPVFTGPDYFSKITAVRSGRCLAVVPQRSIAQPFVEADDDHLPDLPSKKVLLAVRGDPESARLKAVVAMLSSLRFTRPQDRAAPLN